MEEPLVIGVAEEKLIAEDINSEFRDCLVSLSSVLSTLGPLTSGKGNGIETLLRMGLMDWDGTKLDDLPFLQGLKLPLWCTSKKISIAKIGTASQLGFENDLQFLLHRPSGMLLAPVSITRPDSIGFAS
jgi:hypothetical protein